MEHNGHKGTFCAHADNQETFGRLLHDRGDGEIVGEEKDEGFFIVSTEVPIEGGNDAWSQFKKVAKETITEYDTWIAGKVDDGSDDAATTYATTHFKVNLGGVIYWQNADDDEWS